MSNYRLLTDKKEIEIEGAAFTIGIIDRMTWMELQLRREKAFRKFRNLFVAVSSAQDPSKLTPEELQTQAADLGKKVIEGMTDDEVFKSNMELVKVHWDLIKHGVISHSGINDPEGKVILLKKDDGGVVSNETINLYHLRGYFTKLAEEVRAFNELSEAEIKN